MSKTIFDKYNFTPLLGPIHPSPQFILRARAIHNLLQNSSYMKVLQVSFLVLYARVTVCIYHEVLTRNKLTN